VFTTVVLYDPSAHRATHPLKVVINIIINVCFDFDYSHFTTFGQIEILFFLKSAFHFD